MADSLLAEAAAKQPFASGEICLDKARAGVDIDLAQRRVAGVNESMRCVRGNDDDAAGVHFKAFIADRNAGAAFERERDLDVRMRVQWRTLPRLRRNDVNRERCALLFADEFIRHSDKRQLPEIQKAHNGKYLKYFV
jgi:hypothetical protein